jgi:putative hydrolase of the HAD superfamily
MSPRLQHVFFDATDTLLRVRGSVGAVYAPIAARHDFATTASAIDGAFSASIRAAPPPAFPGAAPGAVQRQERDWWRVVVHRTFEPLGPFPRFESFFDEVFELFRTPEPWELLPGARETLESLHAEGRHLGVISDMDSRLHDVLHALDLDRWLGVVVLSPSAGWSKPDPRLFTHALNVAGASAALSVHVGDNLRTDVEGARAAGLTAIYLGERSDAPPGVPSVRSLPELPALLSRLDRG